MPAGKGGRLADIVTVWPEGATGLDPQPHRDDHVGPCVAGAGSGPKIDDFSTHSM